MSTHDEDRLSRSLHDRAADMTGAPLGLADVRRSARGIQRRRRITSGLVAAAVIAVVVPVGLSAVGNQNADRPVAPATTSPSGTPTRAGTPEPTLPRPGGVTPLTVSKASGGDPARIGYLKGSTYVAPDGTNHDLPAAYSTVAPYRGGWLAVQRKEGTPYVVRLDGSGSVVSSQRGGDRIVVSDDGLQVSWAAGGRLYLDTTNGHTETPRSIDLPDADTSPVGFVGPGSVVAGTHGADPAYWVTDFSELRPLRGSPLAVRATNMRLGLLGLQTSYDDNDGTSCWKLASERGGGREPRTCEWAIESFSATAAHLAGYPSDTDGLGPSTVALLDAGTLQPVTRFERVGDGDTFVGEVAWEDDSHVLATLYEDGSWHLVRLGLDGSLERLDEVPGAPEDSPIHFAAHP